MKTSVPIARFIIEHVALRNREKMHLVATVHLTVCVFLYALSAEPFDLVQQRAITPNLWHRRVITSLRRLSVCLVISGADVVDQLLICLKVRSHGLGFEITEPYKGC